MTSRPRTRKRCGAGASRPGARSRTGTESFFETFDASTVQLSGPFRFDERFCQFDPCRRDPPLPCEAQGDELGELNLFEPDEDAQQLDVGSKFSVGAEGVGRDRIKGLAAVLLSEKNPHCDLPLIGKLVRRLVYFSDCR